MGMRPAFTWRRVLWCSAFQSWGAMNISTPASSAAGQSSTLQTFSCSWPFQSPSTMPSKPMRCFSATVSSAWCPCSLRPCQELKLAITVCTPARSVLR